MSGYVEIAVFLDAHSKPDTFIMITYGQHIECPPVVVGLGRWRAVMVANLNRTAPTNQAKAFVYGRRRLAPQTELL